MGTASSKRKENRQIGQPRMAETKAINGWTEEATNSLGLFLVLAGLVPAIHVSYADQQ